MSTRPNLLLMLVLLAILGLGGCGKRDDGSVMYAPSPSANVADNEVTNNVKSALLRSPNLKNFDIAVVTQKGDVRLTGLVDTQEQIDEAVKAARGAEGTHSIHNELGFRK